MQRIYPYYRNYVPSIKICSGYSRTIETMFHLLKYAADIPVLETYVPSIKICSGYTRTIETMFHLLKSFAALDSISLF